MSHAATPALPWLIRVRHQLHYQLERHGRLAAVSLGVLLLALGLQWLWVDGLHAQNQVLREALSAQRAQAAKPQAVDEKAQSQAEFLASLPDTGQVLEVIAVLNQAASRHQVVLANAEYRLTRQGSGPSRYQITLPLRAGYVPLHAWLADVLNALPSAALDDISLKREDVGQTVLDARVRLTVFMRGPG